MCSVVFIILIMIIIMYGHHDNPQSKITRMIFTFIYLILFDKWTLDFSVDQLHTADPSVYVCMYVW